MNLSSLASSFLSIATSAPAEVAAKAPAYLATAEGYVSKAESVITTADGFARELIGLLSSSGVQEAETVAGDVLKLAVSAGTQAAVAAAPAAG